MSEILEIWEPEVGAKEHDPRLRKLCLDEVSLEVLGAVGEDAVPASYLATPSLWPGWLKLGTMSRALVRNRVSGLVSSGLLMPTGVRHKPTASRVLRVSEKGAEVLKLHRLYVEALEGGMDKTA